MVAVGELRARDVAAQLDVSEEAELGVLGRLLVHAADGLDVRVVGRHPAADEPPGGGQPVEHVHLDAEVRMRLLFSRCPAA